MPLVEVVKTYPKEVLIAMGMRFAENVSYYIFTVISLTYVVDYAGLDKQAALNGVLIGSGHPVLPDPRHRLAVGPDRPASALPGRRIGVGVWGFVFFPLIDTAALPADRGRRSPSGLLFHSLMYAPQAAFFSELFGTSSATAVPRSATSWRRCSPGRWHPSSR